MIKGDFDESLDLPLDEGERILKGYQNNNSSVAGDLFQRFCGGDCW